MTHTHKSHSVYTDGQLPVSPELPGAGHTVRPPVNSSSSNKSSWFSYLRMSSFFSFLRLLFSFETTLLFFIRTGWRPPTPPISEYPSKRKTNDTTSKTFFFLKQSVRNHLQRSHSFPKYSLIVTISLVVSA